jgi:hypothetical protein
VLDCPTLDCGFHRQDWAISTSDFHRVVLDVVFPQTAGIFRVGLEDNLGQADSQPTLEIVGRNLT